MHLRSVLATPLVLAAIAACGTRTPLRCEHEVKAAPVPPTLYFVLDHSGSMSHHGKWGSVRAALGTVVDQLGARARLGIAIFPSTAGDGCGAGDEVLAPATQVSKSAVRAATNQEPNGGTPLAATIASIGPRLIALAADAGIVAIVVTDGGPNCNARLSCGVDRCTDNIDQVDATCSPGGTNCCAPNGPAGPEGCLDDAEAAAEIAKLRARGVRTFVLGVPGSEPYAAVLDRLADAGDTARPGSPRYYRAEAADTGVFTTALLALVHDSETSCEVKLGEPVRAENLLVYLDDALVVPIATDGWTLSVDRLSLRGAACGARRAGSALKVMVDDQCPR